MKRIQKNKALIEAVVVIAVTLAFITPVTAIAPKTQAVQNLNHGTLARAEWIEQATGFSEPSRGISYIYCVNENIVWATAYNGLAPRDPCQDYTKTTDGGNNWIPNTVPSADGLSFAMIFALDANTAWAPMYAASGGTQGIYYTSNGGSTWTRQSSADFNSAGAFPDCVHFWDANIGWCLGDPVGGYYEIYTTTDGGTTWTRVPSSDIPAPLAGEFGVVGYYCVLGDTIWFGTNMGRIYKSTDRGFHWTVAQTTLSAYIKPAFNNANHGLAIDLNADGVAMLSETNDGGATWADLTFSGPCHDYDLNYMPGTDNVFVSTGANSGDEGASYSIDGGHSWTSWSEMDTIQCLQNGFTTNAIGWAGNFNTDETTGGIFKHVPGSLSANAGGPYQGVVNTPVQFQGSASGGTYSYTNYTWKVGVGTDKVYGKTPSYTYTAPGTYTINLTVTDSAANKAYAETTATILQSLTTLEVTSISGGFGLKAVVKNTGTPTAENVQVSMHVTGGILGRIDKTVPGSAATLASGNEITVSSGMLLGLGKLSIVVTADADNADAITQEATGIILGLFVIGVKLA
jgi:photosystem II stability/assembly factor-like uncharacterized protein